MPRQNIEYIQKNLKYLTNKGLSYQDSIFTDSLAYYICKTRGHRINPISGSHFRDLSTIEEYWLDGKVLTTKYSFMEQPLLYDSKKTIMEIHTVFERFDLNGEYYDFPVSTYRKNFTKQLTENINEIAYHKILWDTSEDMKMNRYYSKHDTDLLLSNILFSISDIFQPSTNSICYYYNNRHDMNEKNNKYRFSLMKCLVIGTVANSKNGFHEILYRLKPIEIDMVELTRYNLPKVEVTKHSPKDMIIEVSEFDCLFSDNSILYKYVNNMGLEDRSRITGNRLVDINYY